jgi:hypothetical protein
MFAGPIDRAGRASRSLGSNPIDSAAPAGVTSRPTIKREAIRKRRKRAAALRYMFGGHHEARVRAAGTGGSA